MGCDRLRVPFRGGNVNNGGNAGPFYWNCNNGWSNANWNIGGRPHFLAHNFTFYFHFQAFHKFHRNFNKCLHPIFLTPW